MKMPRLGTWLFVVPSAAAGTLLDGNSLIYIFLSTWSSHVPSIQMPLWIHNRHSPSWRFSAVGHSGHAAINDFVQCALNATGSQLQLEPLGLDVGVGKRPIWPFSDGIAVWPFAGGQSLTWDVTCCDMWPQTGFVLSAVQDPARK